MLVCCMLLATGTRNSDTHSPAGSTRYESELGSAPAYNDKPPSAGPNAREVKPWMAYETMAFALNRLSVFSPFCEGGILPATYTDARDVGVSRAIDQVTHPRAGLHQ